MDENIILQRISSLISKNNITPNRLLVSCNVQSNAYTKWKSGIAKPSLDALIKIANYFNVSLDYLVGRTSENDITLNNATSNPVFNRITQLSELQQIQVMAYIDGLQGVKSHTTQIDTRKLVSDALDRGIAENKTNKSKEIITNIGDQLIQHLIAAFQQIGQLFDDNDTLPEHPKLLYYEYDKDGNLVSGVNIENLKEKEIKEEVHTMSKPLKYGQGCVNLRTRKNKNGTEYKFYEVRYYDDYGIRHTTTTKTQAEAIDFLTKNNKRSMRTARRKQPITFGVDLQNWFDTFKKPRLQKGSIYSYQKLLNMIPNTIKKKLLHQVSEIELQNFLNNTVSEKNRYWAKMLLQNYFEIAFNKGLIKANIGKLLYADQPIAAERQTLPREKEKEFIEALPEVYRIYAIAVLYSGCRINELFRIEAEDLDYERNIIWIKETKTLKRGERKTTPYKLRPAFLFPELKQIKFPLPSICLSWLRKAFKHASEKIGITITPHDLRHTYATRLDEMGINREVILFHGNVKMTKHYIHEDKAKKLMKEFEKFNRNQQNTPISTPISY